jgi:hypothetical protein
MRWFSFSVRDLVRVSGGAAHSAPSLTITTFGGGLS